MDRRTPEEPPPRGSTVRESLRAELACGRWTVSELSERVGAPEKELHEHLAHIARSLEARGQHLASEPARCLACGFAFEGRTRFGKPGKCPKCRSTRIAPPRFWIPPE